MYPAEHLVPGAIADEWPLAHAAAKRYENITHIPVRAENVSPLAAIWRSVDILHEPQHAVVNMFWILAILDEARNRNPGGPSHRAIGQWWSLLERWTRTDFLSFLPGPMGQRPACADGMEGAAGVLLAQSD